MFAYLLVLGHNLIPHCHHDRAAVTHHHHEADLYVLGDHDHENDDHDDHHHHEDNEDTDFVSMFMHTPFFNTVVHPQIPLAKECCDHVKLFLAVVFSTCTSIDLLPDRSGSQKPDDRLPSIFSCRLFALKAPPVA
jgi:hypothetical protein